MRPGKVHEYASCTTFSTPSEYMEGHYTFHRLGESSQRGAEVQESSETSYDPESYFAGTELHRDSSEVPQFSQLAWSCA